MGQARSAARQGNDIDAATAIVAESVGKAALKSLTKILSAPTKAVAAIGIAIGHVIAAPFQLLRTIGLSTISTGSAVLTFVKTMGFKILASPGLLANGIISAIGSLQVSTIAVLNNTALHIAALPRYLLLQTKTATSSLAVAIVSGTKSTSIAIYSTIAGHVSQIVWSVKMSLVAGGVRFGNSFEIMISNLVANRKLKIHRFNDAAEETFSKIIEAITNFVWRIGNTGTSK